MLAHHFLGFFQAQTRYPAAEVHAEFFLDKGGEVSLVGIQLGSKVIYRELFLQIRFLQSPFCHSRAQRLDKGFLRTGFSHLFLFLLIDVCLHQRLVFISVVDDVDQDIEIHAHHIELHQPVDQGTRTDGYYAQYQHAVEEPVAHLEPSDEMALLVREVVFEEGIASQIALVEVIDMPYEHL